MFNENHSTKESGALLLRFPTIISIREVFLKITGGTKSLVSAIILLTLFINSSPLSINLRGRMHKNSEVFNHILKY